MKAEIVMIGTELLLGQIVDTNASYLARQLAGIGIDVFRKTTVGDNAERIAHIISSALERCDLVITSGGIGPTVDDRTREAVSIATHRPLVLNQTLLDAIAAFFKRRGLELGENNKRQAYIPQDAVPIENPVGTAPGFIVEQNGRCVVSLPGVPKELYYLSEHALLPYLIKKFRINTVIQTRILRTAGIGESNIDRMIGDLEESDNPTVGLAAHIGAVDIRIAAKADHPNSAKIMLDEMEAKVRARVGDIIFGIDGETIAEKVCDLLQSAGLSLALLETNTGGVFTARLTEIATAFTLLISSQTRSLKSAAAIYLAHTNKSPTPSRELTTKLAQALVNQTDAHIGMALIGDEDPNVGPFKTVAGHTFIGISRKETAPVCRHIQLGGISHDGRTRITSFAFETLRRYLLGQV